MDSGVHDRTRRLKQAWLATWPILLLLGCGQAAYGPAPSVPPTPTPILAPQPSATYFIHLLDTRRFDPAHLEGKPGQLVKLVLVGDHQKHDFTSPGLNVNEDVLPGQVEVVIVELPSAPGDYRFWSAQPGDRAGGMEGILTVR